MMAWFSFVLCGWYLALFENGPLATKRTLSGTVQMALSMVELMTDRHNALEGQFLLGTNPRSGPATRHVRAVLDIASASRRHKYINNNCLGSHMPPCSPTHFPLSAVIGKSDQGELYTYRNRW